jgi:hypothetical protein
MIGSRRWRAKPRARPAAADNFVAAGGVIMNRWTNWIVMAGIAIGVTGWLTPSEARADHGHHHGHHHRHYGYYGGGYYGGGYYGGYVVAPRVSYYGGPYYAYPRPVYYGGYGAYPYAYGAYPYRYGGYPPVGGVSFYYGW